MRPDLNLWEKLPEHFGPIPPIDSIAAIESLRLENMAKVVRLTQNFEQNIPGLRFAYEKIKADTARMGAVLDRLNPSAAESKLPTNRLPLRVRKLHVRYQNSHAILLHIALTLHRGLDREGALGDSKTEDLDFFVQESIKVTEQAMQYRPLGSSSVPFCLAIAYAVTEDESLLRKMESLLSVWESDFEVTRWVDCAIQTKSRMNERGWLHLTNGQF